MSSLELYSFQTSSCRRSRIPDKTISGPAKSRARRFYSVKPSLPGKNTSIPGIGKSSNEKLPHFVIENQKDHEGNRHEPHWPKWKAGSQNAMKRGNINQYDQDHVDEKE